MKIIILAGGGGSRLFPLSRKSYPKQFLCLEDNRSLLAHTVKRFMSFVSAEDIVIITNQKYFYHVQNDLSECHADAAHILLEPVARNTAPAIALSAEFCRSMLNCTDDEVLLYAVWEPISYTITFTFNEEEGALSYNLPTTFIYDQTYTLPAYNTLLETPGWTRNGYEFGGWS